MKVKSEKPFYSKINTSKNIVYFNKCVVEKKEKKMKNKITNRGNVINTLILLSILYFLLSSKPTHNQYT